MYRVGHYAVDIAAAKGAWAMAQEMINDPSFDMVLLDELNICLRYEYLDIAEVVAALQQMKAEHLN